MAYLLYSTTPAAVGTYHKAIGGFVLAGGGLIQAACRRHLTKADGGWTVSRQELLRARGVDPERHSLVVDTSPARDTANLYEIRSISGYSYPNWTPVMIVYQSLFTDDDPPIGDDGTQASVADHKKDFNDAGCPRDVVRSVLYVRGGHKSGDWNWGGNSRTTAALLWGDAWAFFAQAPLE